MRQPTKHFFEFDLFRLDPVERLLYRDGELVPLTAKVFDILLVFVQNSGRTLEKEEVMRQVWPDQFVEEGNLTRNVSTLRKALGESPDDHRYIVTIPGRYFWGQRTETGLNKGLEYFRQAIDKDPNYALAFAGLDEKDQAFAWLARAYDERDEQIVTLKLSFPGNESGTL